MGFLEGSPPRIIAHRGLAVDYPENTLAAFRAALDSGADILETDVHLSRDGEVVIAHDADLKRFAGQPGMVSDFTIAQLRNIDLGKGNSFVLLREALEAFPTARFNIDLKVRAVVEPFVDVVRQLQAQERVLIASFEETHRQVAASMLPGVASSATPPHVLEGRIRSWLGLSLDTWSLPVGMVALQIPVTRFGLGMATPSMIRAAHKKGLEVHVWTINNPVAMRRLWDMGVDGIVTDRADLAHGVRNLMIDKG
jgi:glycerophosphoryl diester phosphodiesterase